MNGSVTKKDLIKLKKRIMKEDRKEDDKMYEKKKKPMGKKMEKFRGRI
jgi:hypothetical protein